MRNVLEGPYAGVLEPVIANSQSRLGSMLPILGMLQLGVEFDQPSPNPSPNTNPKPHLRSLVCRWKWFYPLRWTPNLRFEQNVYIVEGHVAEMLACS